MGPSKIMIIRHAEKPPPDGTDPQGVGESGHIDPNDLIVRGWQRAGALVRFFAPRDGRFSNPAIAQPDHVFAAGVDAETPSKRPSHTIAPLCRVLGPSADDRFLVGEEKAAADAILATDGVVLVCWEHKAIAALVSSITQNAVTSPHWHRIRFDMVLVLDRNGKTWTLTQIPQLLLDGDSPDPL